MHTHGKDEYGGHEQGGQKGIVRVSTGLSGVSGRSPTAQAQKQHQKDCGGDGGPSVKEIGQAEKGLILADPVQTQHSPEIIGVDSGIGVGTHGVEILFGHIVQAEGKTQEQRRDKGESAGSQDAQQALAAHGSGSACRAALGSGARKVSRKALPYHADEEDGGKEEHLGLDQDARQKGKTGGEHATPDQAETHEDQEQGVDGVRLSPDGGIQDHGWLKKIQGGEEQRLQMIQASGGFPVQKQTAAQVAGYGGELQQDQVSGRPVCNAQQGSESSNGIEQVQIAGGIICKDSVGIKTPRAYLKDPVCPGGKACSVIVEAPEGACGDQTQGESQGEQYEKGGRVGAAFAAAKEKAEPEEQQPQ